MIGFSQNFKSFWLKPHYQPLFYPSAKADGNEYCIFEFTPKSHKTTFVSLLTTVRELSFRCTPE